MEGSYKPTFEVDKQGMKKVFARKGKAFIVTELIQVAAVAIAAAESYERFGR